jgi:hypothetical protein
MNASYADRIFRTSNPENNAEMYMDRSRISLPTTALKEVTCFIGP